MIMRRSRMGFAFFERPKMRSRRTLLLLLLGSSGLVMGAAAVLVFTVPSFKHGVKERWHRWACPDVPAIRSERMVATDGTITVRDPFSNDTVFHAFGPNVLFAFDSMRVFPAINMTVPTRGSYLLEGTSAAVARRVGDVSNDLLSVTAGFRMKCSDAAPDVRIVIRIDHPDGTLREWNEKRLLVGEHLPNEWERFNFEWILRDLSISPDDLISVFVAGDDEEVWVDDLCIVFRSRSPLRKILPHA